MFPKKNLFFLLTLCCVIRSSLAQSTCETCLKNLAYCVDETHFYLCGDGSRPSTAGEPYECDAGTFCTNSPKICAAEDPQNNIVKACSSATTCNNCAGRTFTCVSKTEFAFCKNDEVFSRSSCDAGQVCSVELYDDPSTKKLCAPEAVLEFLGYGATCSNAQASTASPPTSTTPSKGSLTQQCSSAEKPGETNRFFYVRNLDDATCQTYIYCERVNNVMDAVLFTCKSGYYDSTTRRCVATKPKECST